MMQNKNQEINSFVQPKTYVKFNLQLSIIQKIIVHSRSILKDTFPRLVFKNPLAFKFPVYRICVQRTIKSNQNCILRKRYSPMTQSLSKNLEITDSTKQTQISALLTIAKQWKPIKMSQQSYNDVLQCGKHFCNFFSNIKIHPLTPNLAQNDIDPLKDYNNYQKKQKQKNKYHYLISDNREMTYRSLQQIWRYEKDKKINIAVIRSFISLMNKSIAIVKVQQNYGSTALGCEGKYVYFQNQYRLPLTKGQNCDSKSLVWLQVDNANRWKLGRSEQKQCLHLYKQILFPFTRKRQSLISKSLQQIQQNDVWIQTSLQSQEKLL